MPRAPGTDEIQSVADGTMGAVIVGMDVEDPVRVDGHEAPGCIDSYFAFRPMSGQFFTKGISIKRSQLEHPGDYIHSDGNRHQAVGVFVLPPGRYTFNHFIVTLAAPFGFGRGSDLWDAVKIPFTVEAGKIKYLGDITEQYRLKQAKDGNWFISEYRFAIKSYCDSAIKRARVIAPALTFSNVEVDLMPQPSENWITPDVYGPPIIIPVSQ